MIPPRALECLSRFDAVPKVVRDDPQLRHHGNFPETSVIVPGAAFDATFAVRLLNIAAAVEDALADIKSVIENAFTPFDVAG
nr:hypothetical protein [Sphingomonas arenae]